MALSYQESANAAVVLKYGEGSSQAIVAGLNTLKLPGGQRTLIDIKEFRQISRQRTGQASRTNLEFGGNAVFNDAGQLLLKEYFDANTVFGPVGDANGHCRVYLNGTDDTLKSSDFLALDTANDTAATFQVVAHDYPSIDSDGVYPFQSGLAVGGRYAFFTNHITATTISFATTGIITDTGDGFVTAGFETGQTIIIESTASSNVGIGLISNVSASQITVTGITLSASAAGVSHTLHGGK